MEGGVVGHTFERDLPKTTFAKFGLIWFSSFRNMKVYVARRTPSARKSSHGLWSGQLKGNINTTHLIGLCRIYCVRLCEKLPSYVFLYNTGLHKCNTLYLFRLRNVIALNKSFFLLHKSIMNSFGFSSAANDNGKYHFYRT